MLPVHDIVSMMGIDHIVMAMAPRHPRCNQSRLCIRCLTRGIVNDRPGMCNYIHKVYDPKTMMMRSEECNTSDKVLLKTYYRTYEFSAYGIQTTMRVLLYEPSPYFIKPRPMNSANFSTECNSGCLHFLACVLGQDLKEFEHLRQSGGTIYRIDVERSRSISLQYMYYSMQIIKNNLLQKELATWTPGTPFQAGMDESMIIQPQVVIAGAIGVSRMIYFHVVDVLNIWLQHHTFH